jgi:hypothetical protein
MTVSVFSDGGLNYTVLRLIRRYQPHLYDEQH